MPTGPMTVMEHDIAFHEAIAAASHNPVFALIVTAFSGVTRRTWVIGWRTRSTDAEQLKMIAGHEDIAAAILKGDPRLAAAHMAEHFDNSVKALHRLRELPEHEDQRDRNHPRRGAAQPALGRGPYRRGPDRPRRDLLHAAHGRGISPRICRAAGDRPRSAGRSTCSPADLVGYLGFRSTGAEMRGNSAFDIALWDIFGKATGQPIAQLLGGFSRHVASAPTTPAPAPNTCKDGQGPERPPITASAPGKAYDDLNGFLHRADELAEELLDEGITGDEDLAVRHRRREDAAASTSRPRT